MRRRSRRVAVRSWTGCWDPALTQPQAQKNGAPHVKSDAIPGGPKVEPFFGRASDSQPGLPGRLGRPDSALQPSLCSEGVPSSAAGIGKGGQLVQASPGPAALSFERTKGLPVYQGPERSRGTEHGSSKPWSASQRPTCLHRLPGRQPRSGKLCDSRKICVAGRRAGAVEPVSGAVGCAHPMCEYAQ